MVGVLHTIPKTHTDSSIISIIHTFIRTYTCIFIHALHNTHVQWTVRNRILSTNKNLILLFFKTPSSPRSLTAALTDIREWVNRKKSENPFTKLFNTDGGALLCVPAIRWMAKCFIRWKRMQINDHFSFYIQLLMPHIVATFSLPPLNLCLFS